MHKSVLLVVAASLLMASPLTMLGISEQSIQQNQNSLKQIADSTTQQKSKQLPFITQEKMQQKQLEKLQQLSVGVQQKQNNELQTTEEVKSRDKQLTVTQE